MIMACAVASAGCGSHTGEGRETASLTAAETAECVMESLKEMDLDRFNACTDNYVATYYSWIGIPVEKEYRVFSELLQPGLRLGSRKEKYRFHRSLSEKMMENLTWEIGEVREEGGQAEIDMEITNLDMMDVMGEYEIQLLENVLESEGAGIGQLLFDVAKITDEEEGLSALIEAHDREDVVTFQVTVRASQEEEGWKLHLDDAFINAFMGNINGEGYDGEIQQQVEMLEERVDEKADEWADEFTDEVERKVEKWMERWDR